jgi:hypothetical protein
MPEPGTVQEPDSLFPLSACGCDACGCTLPCNLVIPASQQHPINAIKDQRHSLSSKPGVASRPRIVDQEGSPDARLVCCQESPMPTGKSQSHSRVPASDTNFPFIPLDRSIRNR